MVEQLELDKKDDLKKSLQLYDEAMKKQLPNKEIDKLRDNYLKEIGFFDKNKNFYIKDEYKYLIPKNTNINKNNTNLANLQIVLNTEFKNSLKEHIEYIEIKQSLDLIKNIKKTNSSEKDKENILLYSNKIGTKNAYGEYIVKDKFREISNQFKSVNLQEDKNAEFKIVMSEDYQQKLDQYLIKNLNLEKEVIVEQKNQTLREKPKEMKKESLQALNAYYASTKNIDISQEEETKLKFAYINSIGQWEKKDGKNILHINKEHRHLIPKGTNISQDKNAELKLALNPRFTIALKKDLEIKELKQSMQKLHVTPKNKEEEKQRNFEFLKRIGSWNKANDNAFEIKPEYRALACDELKKTNIKQDKYAEFKIVMSEGFQQKLNKYLDKELDNNQEKVQNMDVNIKKEKEKEIVR